MSTPHDKPGSRTLGKSLAIIGGLILAIISGFAVNRIEDHWHRDRVTSQPVGESPAEGQLRRMAERDPLPARRDADDTLRKYALTEVEDIPCRTQSATKPATERAGIYGVTHAAVKEDDVIVWRKQFEAMDIQPPAPGREDDPRWVYVWWPGYAVKATNGKLRPPDGTILDPLEVRVAAVTPTTYSADSSDSVRPSVMRGFLYVTYNGELSRTRTSFDSRRTFQDPVYFIVSHEPPEKLGLK